MVDSGRKMQVPHVCLITPGQPSTNPRLVKEADVLVDAGYRVSVICGDFIDWARREDQEYENRGWRIHARLVFGPSSGLGRRVVRKLRGTAARWLFRAGIRSPWVLAAAWHEIGPELISAACGLEADLYIAHYPAALPAAGEAANRHDAKFAFDAEDFHPGDLPDLREHDSARTLLNAIESQFLSAAAYVTAASPLIAKAYSEEYEIPIPKLILNTFPLEQAAKTPTACGTASPGPSLYWFSQTIGPNRGLEAVVEAISISKSKPHLYLRGLPQHGFLDELLAIARRSGIEERVHVLDIGPPSDMVKLAARYDIGLASEVGETANRRIALTNKAFTYLLAGVPVLMSNIPAHCDLAEELGQSCQLFPVDNAVALAACIDRWLLDLDLLRDARQIAYKLAQERYNWKVESQKFLETIEEALI